MTVGHIGFLCLNYNTYEIKDFMIIALESDTIT